MSYGTYVVPVSTFNHAYPITTNEEPSATLGVVLVHAFLHPT